MRRSMIALAAGAAIAALSLASAQAFAPPAYVAAAVSDPGRPAEDTQRDAARKPAEMLEFAEVKPGQKIADLIPGGGYFTRLFAKAVGPQGHVYAFVPKQAENVENLGPNATALAKAYPNVTAQIVPFPGTPFPETLDLVWTAQNYHDFHNSGPKAPGAFNKLAFESLKPGGLYVVIDHADAAGSGLKDTNTLHRIDAAVVRQEVEAAGFQFVAESRAVANPADDHSKSIFDPAIRGHTDQFALKFRKPG